MKPNCQPKINRIHASHPSLRLYGFLSLFLILPGLSPVSLGQRVMERLDRGVIAIIPEPGTVWVSWRLLGTDSQTVSFDVFRAVDGGPEVRLNEEPITEVTWFLATDHDAAVDCTYWVRPIGAQADEAIEGHFFVPAGAPAQPWLELPLQTPDGYKPNDASIGDLDGDGQYEIVLHQTGRSFDNSRNGSTDPPILQAYRLDGTLLWEINLGINIREGAHYTQFMVYDLDSDGRAEIACKTADGSVDGTGQVIGDPEADYRNADGRVLSGPEFFTVFDGMTGAALVTADYVPARHPETSDPTGAQLREIWGDHYGNRSDRFLACVAYLDGEHPSLIFARGYYTRTVLAAFDWRGGVLTHRWTFDSHAGPETNRAFAGQGNHNLSVADVDEDGRDEIVYGSMVIDDDGTGLYSTGWGHGDAIHVADMDPERPGLEVFIPHEVPREYGPNAAACFDARTGELILGVAGDRDIGRGVAFDVDPRFSGFEMWASSGIGGLYTIRGTQPSSDGPRGVEQSTRRPDPMNFGVWWDGDPLRELLDQNRITKWNWMTEEEDLLLLAEDCVANNGTKANPTLSADFLGDWREEVIWPTQDGNTLRIYSSTLPTDRRLPTLMHDSHYRLSVAWQNVAYNQPPHTSYFLGHDMTDPPWPNIITPTLPDNPEEARAAGQAARTTVSMPEVQRYTFGAEHESEGSIFVSRDRTYSATQGYGFETVTAPDQDRFAVFSARVPEGNHRVCVAISPPEASSPLCIKAESRRLILAPQQLSVDAPTTLEFLINTRTPRLPNGSSVRLLDREVGTLHWDARLTLEFIGDPNTISAITIEPANDAPTVYLIGDSTVTDQPGEPYCGWGQMLPLFFDPSVAIANHAESGRSVNSFLHENRFEKIRSTLQAGDFVLIQFGHNDMKESGSGIGPTERFTDQLTDMIETIRDRGATPVLVTAMHRRQFNDDGTIRDTLAGYPQAMRALAEAVGIGLIDLNEMSARFYEAMGPEESTIAFVHYPANSFPGQDETLRDNTHHNAYGAWVLARCVVHALPEALPELAEHLRDDLDAFDPATPPDPAKIMIPTSAQRR